MVRTCGKFEGLPSLRMDVFMAHGNTRHRKSKSLGRALTFSCSATHNRRSNKEQDLFNKASRKQFPCGCEFSSWSLDHNIDNLEAHDVHRAHSPRGHQPLDTLLYAELYVASKMLHIYKS